MQQQFAPHIGAQDGDGWATTAELAGSGLREALEYCGSSLGTDRPDIQGQRLVEIVTWCLSVPGAAGLLEDDALPDLSADNVQLWIGAEPPGGQATALREDVPVPVTGEAERLAALNAMLDEHLEPLVTAVNEATGRPTSALWRSARDRLAGAFVWVGELTGTRDRSCDLARAAVAAPVELRMLDLGTHEMLLHVREGCCLYYRCEAALKCFSCPLLDDEDRRRLVAGGSQ